MELMLSLLQRVKLEGLINQQRCNPSAMVTLVDIIKKVRLSEEEIEKHADRLPDGGYFLGPKALAFEPSSFSFEKEEFRKIKSIVKDGTDYTPVDFGWLDPLLKQFDSPDLQ